MQGEFTRRKFIVGAAALTPLIFFSSAEARNKSLENHPHPHIILPTRLRSGMNSGINHPTNFIIYNSDELRRAWTAIHADRAGDPNFKLPELPEFDPKTQVGALIALGEMNSLKYSIEINGASRGPSGRTIIETTMTVPFNDHGHEDNPAPGKVQPYDLVVFNKRGITRLTFGEPTIQFVFSPVA